MQERIYYCSDGYRYSSRPFTMRELAQKVREEPEKVQYVWAKGWKDWQSADDLDELKEAVRKLLEEEKRKEEERKKQQEEAERQERIRKENAEKRKRFFHHLLGKWKWGVGILLFGAFLVLSIVAVNQWAYSEKDVQASATKEKSKDASPKKKPEKGEKKEMSEPKKVVKAFLDHIGDGELQKAHELQSNPHWKDFERFSSAGKGYGGVDKTYIYDMKELDQEGRAAVFANYFSADPVNGDGVYKQYFYLQRASDGEWRIVDSGLKEGTGGLNTFPSRFEGEWEASEKSFFDVRIEDGAKSLKLSPRCYIHIDLKRKDENGSVFKVLYKRLDGSGCPDLDHEALSSKRELAEIKVSKQDPEKLNFDWKGFYSKKKGSYIKEDLLQMGSGFHELVKKDR